jgi:hypothetical protein
MMSDIDHKQLEQELRRVQRLARAIERRVEQALAGGVADFAHPQLFVDLKDLARGLVRRLGHMGAPCSDPANCDVCHQWSAEYAAMAAADVVPLVPRRPAMRRMVVVGGMRSRVRGRR